VPDAGGAADHARTGAGLTYRAGSVLSLTQAVLQFCAGPATEAPVSKVTCNRDHFAMLFEDYDAMQRRFEAA